MKLAALFSGGKDSTFAAYIMEQQGHEVDCLVSVLPSHPHSWIFHTPNLHLLPLLAKAMGKSLITGESTGEEEDDLSALQNLLSSLEVDGVVTGAIASDYQWDRINGVCEELGLRTFSPLWRKDQHLLLKEIVEAGFRFMMVGTYAEGLGMEWLGRIVDDEALKELSRLSEKYGINVSGEGGEYETLVLDSPMYQAPLVVGACDVQTTRDGGRLTVKEAALG